MNIDKLKSLRDSIHGDCYMGEDWEKQTVDELLAADHEAPAAVEPAPFPQLPRPAWSAKTILTTEDAFTADQMRAYVDADRAQRAAPAVKAEPVPEITVDEREAFEAWIKSDGGDLSTFGSGQNTHYVNRAVNNSWTGWKARAALAATPAAPADALTQAARDVLAERQRQVSVEGWTPEHDDEHQQGELAVAAALYALQRGCDPVMWVTTTDSNVRFLHSIRGWIKPCSKRRALVKSAALALAEIERLDRAAIATQAVQKRGEA